MARSLLAALVAPLVIVAPAVCMAQAPDDDGKLRIIVFGRIRTMRNSKPAARQFCGLTRVIT